MNRLQAELQRLYEPAGRALVLAVAGPGSWERLAPVWQGVQADLELPAPAIAVTGSDGYQLWFSLAEPQPATPLLDALRRRYLAGVPPDRVALTAGAPMPPLEAAPGQWSAFVAPDLAAIFADEPWLDIAPSAEAQAELLSGLKSIRPADLQRALQLLAPAAAPAGAQQDPRSFLLGVMNDPAVDMQLRIEAAKALLAQQRQ